MRGRFGSGARPDHSSRCRTTVDGIVAIDDGATERILGANLVVPDASELVAELALAVETGATLEEVAGTINPSLTEAVMEAATAARGEAVHTLKWRFGGAGPVSSRPAAAIPRRAVRS